ncbi:Hypothetical predicted protein [Paramuricea clavata]|uniref:Uncharacterized protein n=1 Tax=Paramuricea clavata TaxID=317549 RepID=A0A7D9DNN8_PARCT|nr:Hypothetical predicted protein [Paramuricea clavata]
MVLALGVIIVESLEAATLHRHFKDDESSCRKDRDHSKMKKDCAILKEAYLWYFTLIFINDIVLVLCSFVLLLLFADWILFVAPKTLHDQQAPTEQYQQTSQQDQSAIPLHPV